MTTTPSSHTSLLNAHSVAPSQGLAHYFQRSLVDWLFAAALLGGAAYWLLANAKMDGYDQGVLIGVALGAVALGWTWRPLQALAGVVAGVSLMAVGLYGGSVASASTSFGLKYLFSSQSAILWMCTAFVMSLVAYWFGLIFSKARALWTGTALAWVGMAFGFVGLMVRWHESHLISPDIGHIPVSNLYEVFVLFALITTGFYLYYEAKHKTRALGGFVMLVVVAAVAFLLWYSLDRKAHEIAPLVPALQSWWMKIHVPANFIGYGTFSLSAMVAFAYLLKHYAVQKASWKAYAPLFLLGVLLMAEPIIFRGKSMSMAASWWAVYFGISSVVVGGILLARQRIAAALPSFEVLDDIMYKAIAVGFAFFTVATILGALWAADAWGTYWQWDPKETWALIVWLNYAAWLHLRFIKGMRGVLASYWALIGLLITGFAFLGVNMFLSGLHSYGAL
jgi:cytochrome c-type biogenesis protein CcsB